MVVDLICLWFLVFCFKFQVSGLRFQVRGFGFVLLLDGGFESLSHHREYFDKLNVTA